jgi:hypothetical protein
MEIIYVDSLRAHTLFVKYKLGRLYYKYIK